VTVRVRFFAVLRERAGRGEIAWEAAPGETVGTLWARLRVALPNLAPSGESVAFAVNREYVDSAHPLADNDEVAVIPPVSGGVGMRVITWKPGAACTGSPPRPST
jgi:molybdopterin converting factor subunit 1